MTQDFEYEGKNSVSDARAENQPEQVSCCPVCRKGVGNATPNDNSGLADPLPTFPTVSDDDSDSRTKVSEMSETPLRFPTSDALSDGGVSVVTGAPIDTRRTGYAIRFDAVPDVGVRVVYWGGHVISLAEVRPYVRKDGTPSNILVWKTVDGKTALSGLRSKSLSGWGS